MTKESSQDFHVRRSLLTGMGVAAAGIAAGGAAEAAEFSPARHDGDAWMGENAAKHRVWIDTSYGVGGMEALHYSNNILTAMAPSTAAAMPTIRSSSAGGTTRRRSATRTRSG